MVDPAALLKASVEAGKDLFRPMPPAGADGAAPPPRTDKPIVMVPIRALGPRHRERVAIHLLALEPHDRYLRFGYAANDEQIQRYVDGLDFERDDIFGIYNRKLQLLAMAHLAFSTEAGTKACAEFGVSVLAQARGRGYGTRLFERAAIHSRNEGVDMLFIHALSENTAMLKIARNSGAVLERDGSETDAWLRLPPATMDSRVSEMVDERVAETDYHLKTQAKQFWEFLSMDGAGNRPTRGLVRRHDPRDPRRRKSTSWCAQGARPVGTVILFRYP
jgi:GNAT superfamily N-acetyltransferase